MGAAALPIASTVIGGYFAYTGQKQQAAAAADSQKFQQSQADEATKLRKQIGAPVRNGTGDGFATSKLAAMSQLQMGLAGSMTRRAPAANLKLAQPSLLGGAGTKKTTGE